MKKILWIATVVGALVGAITFLLTLVGANSAPQEAAGSAMALCFTVIPYVVARGYSEFKNS